MFSFILTVNLVTASCCYVSRRLSQLSSHDPLWRRHCKKYWLISEWVFGKCILEIWPLASINASLSWFSSLTLVSLTPLVAFLVPASKCRCSPSCYPWLTTLLCLWSLLHALLHFVETTCMLLTPKPECPPLTFPLSSRFLCTTVCWIFLLDDPQGSLNSVNFNKFDRIQG